MEGSGQTPDSSAQPQPTVVDSKTVEEYMDIATANKSLAEKLLEGNDLQGAVDALEAALENAEKAFGEGSEKLAPYFHRFGDVLMQYTSQQAEAAFENRILGGMQEQMEGKEVKISREDLEEDAEEHADDFDNAWDALDMARMLYEKAGDKVGEGDVRLSLGQACLEVEQYEDALTEFIEAAKVFPEGRRKATAEFLRAVAERARGEREACIKAAKEALIQLRAASGNGDIEADILFKEVEDRLKEWDSDAAWVPITTDEVDAAGMEVLNEDDEGSGNEKKRDHPDDDEQQQQQQQQVQEESDASKRHKADESEPKADN